MNQNTTTATGAGASAAHTTIEWAGGFCEKFNGTEAEAHAKVIREGLHDEYLDGSNIDTRAYHGHTEVREYRLGVDGMDWHFVARIYGA